jgi:hypothetical protein
MDLKILFWLEYSVKMKLIPTNKTVEEIQEVISSNLIIITSIHIRYINENRLWHIYANDNDLQQMYLEIYGREHIFKIEGAPTLNEAFHKILDSYYQDKRIEDSGYSITYISRFDEVCEEAMLDMTFTRIFQTYGVSPNVSLEIH